MHFGHHLGYWWLMTYANPGTIWVRALRYTVSVVDQSKKGVTKLSDEADLGVTKLSDEAEGSDEAGTHA